MLSPPDYKAFRARCETNPRYVKIGNIVASILAEPSATSIDMRFSGIHMNGNSLGKIRRLVVDKQILCFKVPYGDVNLDSADGHYDYKYDCLFIAPLDLTKPLYKSFILHEAVHARRDRIGTPTAELSDELAAYVFQAMYLRMSRIGPAQFPSGSGKAVTIFTAAFRIADWLLVQQPVPQSDIQALETALATQGAVSAQAAQNMIQYNAVIPVP